MLGHLTLPGTSLTIHRQLFLTSPTHQSQMVSVNVLKKVNSPNTSYKLWTSKMVEQKSRHSQESPTLATKWLNFWRKGYRFTFVDTFWQSSESWICQLPMLLPVQKMSPINHFHKLPFSTAIRKRRESKDLVWVKKFLGIRMHLFSIYIHICCTCSLHPLFFFEWPASTKILGISVVLPLSRTVPKHKIQLLSTWTSYIFCRRAILDTKHVLARPEWLVASDQSIKII